MDALPEPVATYFATEKSRDFDEQARIFSENAFVHDEDEDYRGLDAIREWKKDANATYQYEAEPLQASIDGNTVKVSVRLTGNFPGSPVEIDHTFTIENGKIARLVIE